MPGVQWTRRGSRPGLKTARTEFIHTFNLFFRLPCFAHRFSCGHLAHSLCIMTSLSTSKIRKAATPNHALQRIRSLRSGCKRTPSWAGSLSLGR